MTQHHNGMIQAFFFTSQGQDIAAFAVFDRARWRDFELEIIPDQFARTPYGKFETVEIRYASTDKDKSWSLHCAPDLGYAPVMIVFREGGKTKSRAQLTDYRMGEGSQRAAIK